MDGFQKSGHKLPKTYLCPFLTSPLTAFVVLFSPWLYNHYYYYTIMI